MVPADKLLTTPLELTVATAVLLLLHTPPVEVFVSVELVPKHTVVIPEIGVVAGTNVVQFPLALPRVQLEVLPDNAKLFRVPFKPFTVASVSVVMSLLLPPANP